MATSRESTLMDSNKHDVLEPLVERLIRDATEAGEFDELPGAGMPLPGAGKFDDDLWWVRVWVKRNHLAGLSDPD